MFAARICTRVRCCCACVWCAVPSVKQCQMGRGLRAYTHTHGNTTHAHTRPRRAVWSSVLCEFSQPAAASRCHIRAVRSALGHIIFPFTYALCEYCHIYEQTAKLWTVDFIYTGMKGNKNKKTRRSRIVFGQKKVYAKFCRMSPRKCTILV